MADTQLRIGHLSPDAPSVDVLVDDEPILTDVAFETISDYLPMEPGRHEVTVLPHGETDPATAVLDETIRLKRGKVHSLLAIGTLDELRPLVTRDRVDPARSDEARVRFVHCCPDAPAVDVTVAGSDRLFRKVPFGKAARYERVDAGAYDLEVGPAGTEDVALSLPDTAFDAGGNYTVYAVGTMADDSLDAIVTRDSVPVVA